MKKKYLILFALAVVTLTLLLSGCGGNVDNLEGKYVATFELNGGKLNIGTTEVSSKINYAYDPDSYILDPATYGNYQISRPGYIFTGWYKTAECNENEKWDFTTQKITSEKLTLFAGWEKEIVYTFTVCYPNGDSLVTLGTYKVDEGAVFEDYRKYAEERDGFTPFGYYADAGYTTPWNFAEKHPGGETDTDIKVYVDYLEGDWIIVNNYSELKSAIGKGNIYLNADIDCEGKELFFKGDFKFTLEGNGHTVSNFTVNKSGTSMNPAVAIFNNLTDTAVIKDVNFSNISAVGVSYPWKLKGGEGEIKDITIENYRAHAIAFAEITAFDNCKIENVRLSNIDICVEGEERELTEAILKQRGMNVVEVNNAKNITFDNVNIRMEKSAEQAWNALFSENNCNNVKRINCNF